MNDRILSKEKICIAAYQLMPFTVIGYGFLNVGLEAVTDTVKSPAALRR
jgi:hypothetical protein